MFIHMIPPPQYVLIVDIIIYWVDGLELFGFFNFFDFLEGANDASSAAHLKFW